MRVSFLYDGGGARIIEDEIISQPPRFYGVIDGTSGIYLPQEEPRLFNGKTGGQVAAYSILSALESSLPEDSLEDIFQKANKTISEMVKAEDLPSQEAEFLPSASFVAVSLNKKDISVLQGGDCLAVWLMKDGDLGGTANRAYDYEKELREIIAGLMKKHKGNSQRMWGEFLPILGKKRRKNINRPQGGFGLLNGQDQIESFWQKFLLKRQQTALLVLFSGGFVPFEWTEHPLFLAEKVISLYQKGGLCLVLQEAREIVKREKNLSHESCPEATAVAIEF